MGKKHYSLLGSDFDEWINSLKGLSYEEIKKRKDGNLLLTPEQADEYMRVLRQAPRIEKEPDAEWRTD